MKKIVLIIAAMLISVSAFCQKDKDWANFKRFEEANKQVSVKPQAVFLGDSITEGWNEDLSFFESNNYLNRGISGQTTSQMLVRFRSDVINLHPKYVAIMAGTNDIAGNNGYIAVEHIAENLISMCELARANKIKVMLCSVTPVDAYGWSKIVKGCPAPIIKDLNSRLEAYAAKTSGVTYVDYFSSLKNETEGLIPEYTKDGCHLTLAGYKVIESIIKPLLK